MSYDFTDLVPYKCKCRVDRSNSQCVTDVTVHCRHSHITILSAWMPVVLYDCHKWLDCHLVHTPKITLFGKRIHRTSKDAEQAEHFND